MALPFYNDYQMRFDYDPQNNKFPFSRRSIGPQTWTDIDENADVTPDDDNGIWVSAAGNDGDNGTEAAPKLTILAAIQACTAAKMYVWVDDSTDYIEDLSTFTNEYFSGLYANTGETPRYLNLDATYISDYETIYSADEFIFVSDDTGDDVAGLGTEAAPYATIAKAVSEVAVGKENICIMDSATYTEPGIEFAGNFQSLWAMLGEVPVFNVEIITGLVSLAASANVATTEFESGATAYISTSALSNDNIAIAFQDFDDGLKGKFKIISRDGDTVYDAVEFESGSTLYISTSVLSNDNIIIAFRDADDGGKGKFIIVSESGSVVVATTEFEAGSTSYISTSVLSNDNIIIAFKEQVKGQFKIVDSAGADVVVTTEFESGATSHVSTSVLSNDNIIIAFQDGGDGEKGKFKIIDSAGADVVATTEFEAGSTSYISTSVLSNDNIIIAFMDDDDGNKGKFKIIDSAGAEVVATTEFESGSTANIFTSVLSNDNIIIAFTDAGDGSKGKFKIIDGDGVDVVATTEFEAGGAGVGQTSVLSNDNIIIAFYDAGDASKGKFVIYYPPTFDMILASIDGEIHGMTLTQDYDNWCGAMVHGDSSEVFLRYCEIENAVNGSGREAWAVYADDIVTMENCIIHDGDQGVYCAANEATIEQSLFYRNLEGYAIHIDGTAAVADDIYIEHNTIFSNYAGLRLENNGGTAGGEKETVKNNIFHENSNYGINADTAMVHSYSVCTDTNNNVTAGTAVINANPLFVNEGEIVPADIDLQIKIRVFDHPADSPAYLLSDDSSPDRDAGCYDVVPVGDVVSWSTMTIEKPQDGIEVTQYPVGATRLVKKDGTIATACEAWGEEVGFKFRGILNADYLSIMDMMTCGSSEVRWYPDPTTSVSDYNTYTLIYDDCEASAEHYKLTRTGVQNLKFKMARAYS